MAKKSKKPAQWRACLFSTYLSRLGEVSHLSGIGHLTKIILHSFSFYNYAYHFLFSLCAFFVAASTRR